jgi:hypothetical protein
MLCAEQAIHFLYTMSATDVTAFLCTNKAKHRIIITNHSKDLIFEREKKTYRKKREMFETLDYFCSKANINYINSVEAFEVPPSQTHL